jgi:ATP-dependent DNA ligase
MRSALKFKWPRIRISEYVEASATDMVRAVRSKDSKGSLGKRKDSFYEPGKRSGAWIKYRVNRGQELVIGGFMPGVHGLDSIIVGYYKGDDLIYDAKLLAEISTTLSNSGCLESADVGSLIGRFAVKVETTINEPTQSSFQHELT